MEMKFQAVNFPAPVLPLRTGAFHATAREGATGILATGKVLPTGYQVAGLDANEDTFSFYGRSMNNPEWTPGIALLACKCFHSTKNCSGIVFAGLTLLALTDQDEAWGKWKPSDSRCSKDAVISDPVTIKQEETEPSKASSVRASPS